MDPAWRSGAQAAFALALQHHPLCHKFRQDRFRWGRMAVCSGCAVAFPAMAVGLAGGAVAIVVLWWAPWATLAAGFVLGAPQGLTYLVRFSRPVRAAIKGLGGLGLGLATAAWLFLPVPWIWRWAGAAALGILFAGLQVLRLRSILDTCRACPWAMDWEACPGFRREEPHEAEWLRTT